MPTSRPFPVRVVSVQDGDSLVVRPTRSGRDEQFRLRLYAIDAPEGDQRYGHEARDYLRRLVWNRTDLMLESMDTDQYGRLVGVLYYRGTDRRRSINRLMVQQGLARWYSRYGGHGLGLEQAERDARRRRRGVWATRNSVAPWERRRAQRREAKQTGRLKWLLLGLLVGAVVLVGLALLTRMT
jgi:micrococcal nuclease